MTSRSISRNPGVLRGLGEVDFIVVFEGEDMDPAFKCDVVLERHELSVQTMEVTPTDFAELVEDS